jgi:hypothetical protein
MASNGFDFGLTGAKASQMFTGRESFADDRYMRRLWSQSPCACRQPIRDSAKRAANIAHVSPHPSPAWQSVRTRQRGSQIDPIYIQGRLWRVPQQSGPQFGVGRPWAIRTSRGRLARSATADHIRFAAAGQFCSDRLRKRITIFGIRDQKHLIRFKGSEP